MARVDFKPGTLEAPLPAVLVTVHSGEEDNILTVAWTGILSSDPPRAYIAVRPQRHSHPMLLASREFVIHLTNEKLARATDYCGVYTGAKVDKFAKCGFTKLESKCVAAPTIAEAPVALECRVFDVISSGTHDIFLADIVNVSCDDALLDENGKLCFDRADLIAYSHGEYYALGKRIGKFGFSAAKKNSTARKHSAARKKKPEKEK